MASEVDELIDEPVEGSSLIRHFSFDHKQLDTLPLLPIQQKIHPTCGYFRSTARHEEFPYLTNADPIQTKFDPQMKPLYEVIQNYEDTFYCRRHPRMESIRELYCTHVLNHALKCRKLLLKNNAREEKLQQPDDSLRDQGFHRARTLLLLPTREAARRTVHCILRLMPKGSTVSHRKRFEREFGPHEGQSDKAKRHGKKPPDYEEWFSSNTHDQFRIGLAFAKKTVKLYSGFAESDVIIASPLGIQTLMDEKGDNELDIQRITASIELLIIDQAEMLFMQNWSCVQQIIMQLNQRPKVASISSPARIRLAYLAGLGARYRQTLVFSAVACHLIMSISCFCENFQGANYFLPLPEYQGLYPSYLPDCIRVPGLKRNAKSLVAELPANKKEKLHIDEPSAISKLDNLKLNLITFGIGTSSTSGLGSKSRVRFEGSSDDESEMTSDEEGESKYDTPSGPSKGQGQMDYVTVGKLPPRNVEFAKQGGRAVPLGRMSAFKQRILPRLRKGVDQRVLIYVPDYYDLEELRHLLHEESLDFCYIHEYLDDNEAERYRHLFDQGRIRILLVSERYYFFRRRKLRGARNFIFYGPPTFPWFVRELLSVCDHAPAAPTTATGEALAVASVNKLSADTCSITILYFPPWEALQVAMITGNVDV